jgi:carboxypeptidase Taq
MSQSSKLLSGFNSIEKEISDLKSISALLGWDRDVNLPSKASAQRADQEAMMDLKIHELLTSKRLVNLVKKLSSKTIYAKLSVKDKKRVDLYNWLLKRLLKVPKAYVEEYSRAVSLAHHAWLEARKKESYKEFAPHLKKVFDLKKKGAKYVDAKKHPYDVILDEYERGLTMAEVERVFSELRIGLKRLLGDIKSSPNYDSINKKKSVLQAEFPKDAQLELCRDMITRIYIDNDRTMFAETVHPFMSKISADDMRITTAIRPDPMFGFFSTVHESGHALYEADVDLDIRGTILSGDGVISFPLHESQSRIWENIICDSEAFWRGYYPIYSSRFPALKKISVKEFYQAINVVEPSLVRIEADELTYGLHIIIRYEIEKALFEDKIKVEDLEQVWNQKYKEYLGIIPDKPSRGVLQDSHWAGGAIGYFPTYIFGSIYSAMLYNAMLRLNPNLEKEIEKLDFNFIHSWLKDNVHKFGAGKDTKDIIKDACGKGLDVRDYLGYLKKKYYKMYGIGQR